MPSTHLHKDTRPYYSQSNALSIKAIADSMIASGKHQKIYAKPRGVSVNTLEKIFSQGAIWLMDNGPEKLRYTQWRRSIKVTRDHAAGYILLEWKIINGHQFQQILDATPRDFTPVENVHVTSARNREVMNINGTSVKVKDLTHGTINDEWKAALEDFILGEGAAKLDISEITLSDSDIVFIRGSLVGMSDVKVVKLDKNHIVIERV